MARYIWITDIHLNFLRIEDRFSFYIKIRELAPDAILISGDIAEANSIAYLLNEFVKVINVNIYFVAGNHDYYLGSVDSTRSVLHSLHEINKQLVWLPACKPVCLNKSTVLIGQDGWADGRYGDYLNSDVCLNDSLLIKELFEHKKHDKNSLLNIMQELADKDAQALKVQLIETKLLNPKLILVLTHVPPFKENCMYEGKMSSDEFLPFFSSKATGDVLLEFATDNPEIDLLVLCGHTHHEAIFSPRLNLIVKAGAAEYHTPQIQEIFEF